MASPEIEQEALLNFWFPTPAFQKWWFKSTPELDTSIRNQWESSYQRGRDGQLESWKETPEGYVALIVVLDQLPRNMYRGTNQARVTDPEAQKLTLEFLSKGYDNKVSISHLVFALMPLRHSPLPLHQERVQTVISEQEQKRTLTEAEKDIWVRFKRASQKSLHKSTKID